MLYGYNFLTVNKITLTSNSEVHYVFVHAYGFPDFVTKSGTYKPNRGPTDMKQ